DNVVLPVRILLSQPIRVPRRIYCPKAALNLFCGAGLSPRIAFIFHGEEYRPAGHRGIMAAGAWFAQGHPAIKAKLRQFSRVQPCGRSIFFVSGPEHVPVESEDCGRALRGYNFEAKLALSQFDPSSARLASVSPDLHEAPPTCDQNDPGRGCQKHSSHTTAPSSSRVRIR